MKRAKKIWRDFGGFWRLLAFGAIIGEAAISGSFLSEQMKNPLPYWWGFYLATIQGLATFGGVNVTQRGSPKAKRKGWVIVLIGGGAGMAFSFMFFGGIHDPVIGTIMGLFPTGVAVMAGLIESNQQDIVRAERLEEDDKEFERERIRQADKFRQDRELERDRLRTQVKMEEVRIRSMSAQNGHTDGHNGHADGHGRSVSAIGRTDEDKSAFVKWYMEHPSATGADVARAFGCSERTGRRWIAEMSTPNGVVH